MIERSQLSQRRVEEKVGFSRGYLSQLLAENLDLKVWHVLAVLEVFDLHPGEFFLKLYPVRRRPAGRPPAAAPSGEEIDEVLERLYSLGAESLSRLRLRLVRCEQAVADLEGTGPVADLSASGED